ncbi:MAG: hypothetical protein ACJA2W_001048 [Planctomycetota bacterium]|jgi:hypothetical protein
MMKAGGRNAAVRDSGTPWSNNGTAVGVVGHRVTPRAIVGVGDSVPTPVLSSLHHRYSRVA